MSIKITDRVWQLAEPICAQIGLSIWDIEYVKEGTEFYLRVYIDSQAGISSEDCEAVSKALGSILDEEDFIDRSYIFEVCSPGIERRIKSPEHFDKMMGEKIKVRCFVAQDGKKELIGILKGSSDESVTIETNGELRTIEKKNISVCNAVFDF